MKNEGVGFVIPSPGGKVAERQRGRMRNAAGNLKFGKSKDLFLQFNISPFLTRQLR